jgi:hypothetical protein
MSYLQRHVEAVAGDARRIFTEPSGEAVVANSGGVAVLIPAEDDSVGVNANAGGLGYGEVGISAGQSEVAEESGLLYNGWCVGYKNRHIAKGRHRMGSNPVNLAVRFVLEIAGLAALGWWGWHQGNGIFRFVLAVGIPILAAALWGTFAVPDDPSRSGKAPVSVPGIVRLVFELAFFAAATWALFAIGLTALAWIYGVAVLIHYAISYDRILWLIRQ